MSDVYTGVITNDGVYWLIVLAVIMLIATIVIAIQEHGK